jgi:hypothetical protein
MVVGAKPHCFGVRLENERFLDPTYWKKPRDKFIWWERICGLRSQDRRAMPTIGEESWVLKLEILCTSRYDLWEVYIISRYEASSHLGSLDRSRLRRREVSSLPIGIATTTVRCAQFVPCLSTEKWLRVPKEQIPMKNLNASEDLFYQEYPVKFLETSKRVTQNKKIKMCKVQWSHYTEVEAT